MDTIYKNCMFSDKDVINIDDWIPDGAFNPHKVRPWLLLGQFGVIGVVFADCLGEAFDIAADNDRMRAYAVLDSDFNAMTENEQNECGFFGNNGAPYDVTYLDAIELPNVKASFVAQFNAGKGD